MAWDKGFNFRQTSGYVTDGTNETYVIGETYPTTRNGCTFGWDSAPDLARDRNSALDRRLAGQNQIANNSTPQNFRVDLPATGDYTITLAIGQPTFSTDIAAETKDDSTVLSTYDSTTIGTTQWMDATGVIRTSAADWVSNQQTENQTFATTIFRFNAGIYTYTDPTTIAHIFLSQVGGGLTVLLSDSVTVIENVSNNLITVRLKVSVSDAINIAEFTKEPITPLIIRLNEAITVLENLKAVVSPLTISGIEIITVIDNAIASLSTVRLNITASDAISVVESVSAELSGITGLTKSVNEAISAIENIVVSLLTIRYKVSVSEAISVLENLTAQLIYILYKITVFDSITVTENIAVLLTGGFEAKPYNIMSFAIDNDISKSISFQGNILPISITTGTPTAAPPSNKGVVFKVLGGVVTIFVWDGSAWREK